MQTSNIKKKIHLIWAHPRSTSLTARVVDAVRQAAEQSGLMVEELDLYRLDFDPVIREPDEPDFKNPAKPYSKEVTDLAHSLQGSDAAVIVFPVWWYSLPAMLKGYIERVWNYGLVYGNGQRLPFSKIRWIALVGGGKSRFVKDKKDAYLSDLLDDGISKYCGVNDSHVTYLYNTLAYEEDTPDLGKHHLGLIAEAESVVRKLADDLAIAAKSEAAEEGKYANAG